MKVSDLITKDEHIVKTLELKGRFGSTPKIRVFATNKRLIIERREYIREIAYQHIASMTIGEQFGKLFILTGALIAIVGAVGLIDTIEFVSDILPDAVSGALLVLGLILFGYGFIRKKILSITLPGIVNYETLNGVGVDLEKLLAIVRNSHTAE